MGANIPLRREGHTQRDEEATVDVFEVSESIKWFDASKGYGFIVPDEDLPDVLLHVTCLRRDGFQTAYEGARVVCEVLRRPKGLQAFRIRADGRFDGGAPLAIAAADPRRCRARRATGSGRL